jgi:putative phosphoribosyl transferase
MDRFKNRTEAGKQLAEELKIHSGKEDLIVLALPRGGVPVAFEVARTLNVPLDVFVVRKLGAPGQEELAMGAIASGAVRVLNHRVINSLNLLDEDIDRVAAREQAEVDRREQAYRGARPPLELKGKFVIVIDDGLATGATMRAAVTALRARDVAHLIVAVPVAPVETYKEFQQAGDEIVVLSTPKPFAAIGQWYEEFGQTTDAEVRDLLARAAREIPATRE